MDADATPLGDAEGAGFFRQSEAQLAAYVEHFFALARRDDKGFTARHHWERLLTASKPSARERAKKFLTPPDYPRRYDYLLGYFWELHSTRGSGAMGPAPISHGDIYHWRTNLDLAVTPWEISVITLLDRAFFRAAADKPAEKAAPAKAI